MYTPIVIAMVYSFNQNKLSTQWTGFSLKWYIELFKDKSMFKALTNSLILATLSSVAAAIIGTISAVGMQRVKFKSKGIVEYISTLPIMIPEIILGMVFLAFFSAIGIPLGMTSLVIAHTSFCIPYVFMQVKARLVGMDSSLVEAAKDLGASEYKAFYDITLPLVTPAIVSGMLISFAMSMDDVIISMFLSNVNVNTLPMKIYTQLKSGVTPKTNAICTLMFVLTVVLGALSNIIGRNKSK